MAPNTPAAPSSSCAFDAVANWMHRWLPGRLAHRIVRWKNVLLQMNFYNFARRKPDTTRRAILKLAQKQLGPDFDAGKHFNPRYDPWDERLCLVPDGDLFTAIRSGKASVVTDEIETFTEKGLQLRTGDELEASAVYFQSRAVDQYVQGPLRHPSEGD
jgi:monooxygenase